MGCRKCREDRRGNEATGGGRAGELGRSGEHGRLRGWSWGRRGSWRAARGARGRLLAASLGRCMVRPRRMGKRRSCGQHTTGTSSPWRCCWTAAPTRRPRATSAHRLRHRHVAPSVLFEVAMWPSAVPGVFGLLLGRRGRERAPWSGVSGVGAGRERVSVDCMAVADVVVCCRGWCACWALQSGYTALMIAAKNGKAKVMASLLDRGADPEAKSNVSSSAAPPACRPVGVVRSRYVAICSAGRVRPAARAAGPGARTLERRVGGGCGAGESFG